jgi:hypothetical protein
MCTLGFKEETKQILAMDVLSLLLAPWKFPFLIKENLGSLIFSFFLLDFNFSKILSFSYLHTEKESWE